jgi:hypothetical protein
MRVNQVVVNASEIFLFLALASGTVLDEFGSADLQSAPRRAR